MDITTRRMRRANPRLPGNVTGPLEQKRMKHIAIATLLILCCGCTTLRFWKCAYFPGMHAGSPHTLNARASEELRTRLMDKKFIAEVLSTKKEYVPIREAVLKQWSPRVTMQKDFFEFYQEGFDTVLPSRLQPLFYKLYHDIWATVWAVQTDFQSDPNNRRVPTPEEIEAGKWEIRISPYSSK